MENHPIPQDITGFQFKLVGNMTVKQFAYLAAGIASAWFFYILPIPFLIRLPFIITLAGFGGALAFIPVEGRPMDTMLYNLIKAMFSPTQYIYKQTGGDISGGISQPPISQKPIQAIVNPPPPPPPAPTPVMQALSVQMQTTPAVVQKEEPELPKGIIEAIPPQPPIPPAAEEKNIQSQNQPVNADDTKASDLEKNLEALEKEAKQTDESKLEDELNSAKKEEVSQQGSSSYDIAHQKVLDLETKLNETLSQKQTLEQEVRELRAKLDDQKTQVFTPVDAPVKQETKSVIKIPAGQGKSFGIPNAPDVPNLISGIIKDSRGNPLGNILVEIKDNEDNPVRAFKTNGLGQFASATPVSNGVYTVSFEDPQLIHKFDAVEIEANGDIISPIEVISTDAREELRRQLFN